jgi:hypothetical protein
MKIKEGMPMRIAVLFLSLFLTACTWNDYIAPPEKAVAEVKKDTWECERDAGMATGQFFFIQLQELQDQCMEVRGYQPHN